MRKKSTFAILLALAIAALASPVYSADGNQWNKWGVEPYAATLREACAKAPVAIGGFTMPPEVKDYFAQTIGATCPKGGKEVWLTPNMVLEQMWSGGPRPHVMDKRTVAELPILTSPDGRPYRKGSVAETVKAFAWVAIHEGKTYIVYLPLVCFNWSWALGPDSFPPPSAPQVLAKATVEKCATLEYTVEPGDKPRFMISARKRLPSSPCWQLCDGKICSALPAPCDSCDWVGPNSVIPDEFEPVHTGTYVATEARQSLSFPRAVMNSYVALCVERDGLGESDSWVVPPSVWDGEVTVINIPYGGQEWPVWGQYDSSK